MGKLLLAVVCLSAFASAQGVLERLEGGFNVLATGTNAAGTVFVELDGMPRNIDAALKAGLPEEASKQMAIIVGNGGSSGVVHYGAIFGVKATIFTNDWISFAHMKSSMFEVNSIVIEGDGGKLLTRAGVSTASRLNPPARRVPRVSTSPRDGCTSNTSSSGSSMSCYSSGRLTYRSTCTVNPTTYAISCRSDSY